MVIIKAFPIDLLLVEDNEGDVRLIKEAISESGVPTKLNVVNDGEEALKYLRKKGKYKDASRPEFILLDLNLPKINGTEVLAEIKSDEDLEDIFVIILTVSTDDEDRIKTYDNRATTYLVKPLDKNQYKTIANNMRKMKEDREREYY